MQSGKVKLASEAVRTEKRVREYESIDAASDIGLTRGGGLILAPQEQINIELWLVSKHPESKPTAFLLSKLPKVETLGKV